MHESRALGRVVVVGGANTDVVGRPDAPLIAADSNPGHALVSAGGVGRNIAENLARLGVGVSLVTAFGDDHNAAELERGCIESGISTADALHAKELPGSLYLAILDHDGDMALALNDMRALELLDVEALSQRRATFAAADVVIADANLAPEALGWLAAQELAFLVLAPVSAAKAPRMRGALSGADALVCNALEAGAVLSQPPPRDAAGVERLADELRALGVDRVVITRDADGVYYSSEAERGHLPAPAVEIVNATGAGDAFVAGFSAGILAEESLERCVRLGSAMAAFALASEQTVSPHVSAQALRAMVEEGSW